MYHLSQATSQAIGSVRGCGHAEASRSGDEPTTLGNPRSPSQCSIPSDRPRPLLTSGAPGSPPSSCGQYSSASDWAKKKDFGSPGRQRPGSQRRNSTAAPYPSPKTQRGQPLPENVDTWFKHYIEAPYQQATTRQVSDNTLRHLEYHSHPVMFDIYSRGQSGISVQTLLSKCCFDGGDTRLGRLINFQLVNPPIHLKLPDGTFAQHTVGGIKISDSMTIYELCTKIAGKMGTSLDGWDVKNLTVLSLELAQHSVICFLGSTHSTTI